MSVTTLQDFAQFIALDHGLAVVSTTRSDGTIQSSVVNAGVLDHPTRSEPVIAFVSAGTAGRLANLRARPRATVVLRAGWQWAAVEGPVELAGPDDPLAGIDAEQLPGLLRDIFVAAGGVARRLEGVRPRDGERTAGRSAGPRTRMYGNG